MKGSSVVKIVRFDDDTVQALQAIATELHFYRIQFLGALEHLEQIVDRMKETGQRILVEEEYAPEVVIRPIYLSEGKVAD